MAYEIPPVASTPPPQSNGQPAESHRAAYERMKTDRQSYLDRARMCSKLTIPRLVKEEGANGHTELPTPFQSVGARGVNNLSSKLTMALFPANIPFFKFMVEPYAKEIAQAAQTQEKDPQSEIEKNLVKAEQAVQTELETAGWRPTAHAALQHLIVAGNFVVYMPKGTTKSRVFHLEQFVVLRDPDSGDPIDLILCETIDARVLPKELSALLKAEDKRTKKTFELYTRAEFDGTKWEISQEIETTPVPDTMGSYAPDTFPYIVVRVFAISGENYSRSIIEDYLGDLLSLEGLSQVILEGSAAAANVKWLVRPGSLTDKDELADMPNGGYGDGSAEDVTAVQLQKYGDFRVAAETAAAIEKRLELAFLLNTSIQRNGERVTAEEIRYMAEELETSMGGLYSLLSLEFQLPLVNLLVKRMIEQKRLPKINKKIVKPQIVTGIEAIGRGNDAARLMEFAQIVRTTFGEQGATQFMNPFEFTKRLATARGIRSEGLVLDGTEQKQQQQQGQLQSIIEKLGPEALKQLGAQGGAPA